MHKGLKILVMASFAYNIAAGAFAPLYAIFVEKIGGSVVETSIAWSAQPFTIGLLIFLLGRIEDRLNKRKMLVIGYSMYFVSFLSYIFVQNIFQLFIVQILLGIAGAVTIPAFDAFYSRQLDRGRESSEWAVWESGARIIAAASAVAGGFITAQFGFRVLFMTMSLFSALSVFLIIHLLQKKEYKKLFHFKS